LVFIKNKFVTMHGHMNVKCGEIYTSKRIEQVGVMVIFRICV